MKRVDAIRSIRLNYTRLGVLVYLRSHDRQGCRRVWVLLRDPDQIIVEQHALADGAYT